MRPQAPCSTSSFPPREQWQEITPAEARELLRRVFGRWGLPERFRIDNGHPWGSGSDLPTELALWLLGLGVVPDWNPARQPWLNPKVERNNGVTQQWVEISDCPDHVTLKERLAWAGRLQRELYPARAGRTRLETYPELTRILRPYSVESEPTLWQLGRVDDFLAGRSWRRRADRYGSIWLYNRSQSLGKAHAGKEVQVGFDPLTRHWVVTDASDGGPLVRLIAHELSQERILSLNVSHRRPPRKKKPRPQDSSTTSTT
jgi:hypothetical protein